jgi:type IV fimbrial biogenesis protein FimT
MDVNRRERRSKPTNRQAAVAGMVRSRGFTLVEVMITIAIVAIGLGLAQPAMQSFIQSSRVSAAASEMQAALARARQEAIARNTYVTVEPLAGGWSSGYRLYVNPLNNASWTAASAAGSLGTALPLIIGQGASSSPSLQWPTNACDGTTALTYATFDDGGRPRVATGSASGAASKTGRITACTAAGGCSTLGSCKEILVDTLGRMRVQTH